MSKAQSQTPASSSTSGTPAPSKTEAQARLDTLKAWLDEHLKALLDEHEVPGAAVAVSVGDKVVDAAAGVLNTGTGVEATPDSVFQIGSVTKVWTTT
ncbi:serine hydrolase, partial [Streptomyces sp. NPDC059063]